jgi:hypothetical protein
MKVSIGKYKKNGSRNVKVDITNEDLFSLDRTLALIIHPCLVAIKDAKCGTPFTEFKDIDIATNDDSDVVDNLGSFSEQRWDAIIDEMIWAFDAIIEGKSDYRSVDGFALYEKRVQNGLNLFGKYYQALWT